MNFGSFMQGFGGTAQAGLKGLMMKDMMQGPQQLPTAATIETEPGDLPIGQFPAFSPLKQMMLNLGIGSPSRY